MAEVDANVGNTCQNYRIPINNNLTDELMELENMENEEGEIIEPDEFTDLGNISNNSTKVNRYFSSTYV